MKFLSIIIPIYNGENYIKHCLKSIYNSSNILDRFEVIIIDDESPDKSIDIINEFKNQYTNITIFSQKNKGLGGARNSGINLAKGEYIWFIDQDDWITEGAIYRISQFINSYKPEILSFEYQYPSGARSSIKNYAKCGQIYTGKEFLNMNVVENPVWHYVIKTSFISEYKLRFQEINHEDTLFTTTAFYYAQSVIYDNSVNYIYNLRNNSLSSTLASLEHCLDLNNVILKLNHFKSINAKTYFEKKILSKYIVIAFSAIFFYWKKLNKPDKIKISSTLNSSILKKSLLYWFNIKYIYAFIYVKCTTSYHV